MKNGLAALTGVPIFEEFTNSYTFLNQLHDKLKAAEDAHYIMAAQIYDYFTSGWSLNKCGLPVNHGFAILSAFNMTNANGNTTRMVMLRDPYGWTHYNGSWSTSDSNWT